MKLSRHLSGAFAVILTAGTLAGCGGGSAPSAAATHHKLVVWSYLTQPEVAVLQKEANQWAKKTGNTVKIVYTNTSMQAYATAAHSGKGPDMVFGIPDDNLGTFQIAGLIAKVPSGVINPSNYNAVALNATRFNGVQYAVPLDLETYALFYNKKLVPTPPTTFNQLFSLAKALDQKHANSGFEYDINNFYYSYAFLSGFGGYVFGGSHGKLNPNQIGLGNSGAIEGLAFIRSFVTQGFMPADITGNIADANFAHGKLGMLIDGPWDISTYQKAGVNFGIVPLPTLPNGQHPGSFFGTQSAFVSSTVSPTDQQLSWSLMKYLVQNSPIPLLNAGNRIPALKTVQAQALQINPYLAPFMQQSKWAQPMPNIPAMQAVWTPGADTLTEVTKGAESPSAGAANMVKEVQAGIQQMK